MTALRPLAIALAAVAVVPAAAAAAPVLDPLKPCYDAVAPKDPQTGLPITEPVTVSGSGFTADALVDIAIDGSPVAVGVPVDAQGVLAPGTIDAPYTAKGPSPFSVTLTEQANPLNTVTLTSLVTRLAVRVSPRSATARQRVRFRGTGFTADTPVYAHYLRRGASRRTVRLVRRPAGPCGTFSVRRQQFPFKPAVGRWIVQLDQQRRYEKTPDTAFLQLRIDVS